MSKPQYATNEDLAAMEAEHNSWLDQLDTSHIAPLDDDWAKHPFWADAKDLQDESTEAGQLVKAMQGEFSPTERASSCKDAGNEALQQGRKLKRKHLIESAVAKYTEGLSILAAAEGKPEPALLCALCSNRAFAESLLGNWRNSLESALWAIRADSTHLKSFYRAARAAKELRRWQQGQTLCANGLEIEADARELLDIQEDCVRGAEEEKQRNAAAEAAEEKRLAPYRKVAKHIVGRGYRVTRPQFGLQATGNLATPHLDDEGLLHFPMLLFYPEAHPYHDTIEDCCETDVIGDHLDEVFGEGAPALPWDEAGQYSRARVRLYYCAHAGTVMKEGQLVDALQGKWPSNYVELGTQRYGDKVSTMKPVDGGWTFQQLLSQPDHVMPGVPVLWVVSESTAFQKTFLERFDPRS